MDDKFSMIKTVVECYKIRHNSGMYWADITIDGNHKNSGRIQIASDYGDWQYYWGACGESFKEFLIHLNIDYVAGKFGEDHWVDVDKTIKMYKNYVLESRRKEYFTAEFARIIYDEITYASDANDGQLADVIHTYCPTLLREFDYCPDLCYSISPLFRKFWDELWSILIETFKKELADAKNI